MLCSINVTETLENPAIKNFDVHEDSQKETPIKYERRNTRKTNKTKTKQNEKKSMLRRLR